MLSPAIPTSFKADLALISISNEGAKLFATCHLVISVMCVILEKWNGDLCWTYKTEDEVQTELRSDKEQSGSSMPLFLWAGTNSKAQQSIFRYLSCDETYGLPYVVLDTFGQLLLACYCKKQRKQKCQLEAYLWVIKLHKALRAYWVALIVWLRWRPL